MANLLLLIMFWACAAFGLPGDPIRNNAHVEQFRATLKSGKQVDLYATKPSNLIIEEKDRDNVDLLSEPRLFPRSNENARLANRVIWNATDFIDAYAQSKGHVNSRTEEHHRWELFQLASGQWPMIVGTQKDNPEAVEFTVAFANNAGAKPYQRRFYGNGIPEVPNEWVEEDVTVNTLVNGVPNGPFIAPVIRYDEAIGHFVYDEITQFLSLLPWIKLHGPGNEAKFLLLAEGASSEYLDAAQPIITALGLHRWTHRKINWQELQAQRASLDANYRFLYAEFKKYFRNRLQKCQSDKERRDTESYFCGVEDRIFRLRKFQRDVAVAHIALQVSEIDGTRKQEAVEKLFFRKFGVGHWPTHNFVEDNKYGTAGVRTKIHEIPIGRYDMEVMQAFDKETGLLNPEITYERIETMGCRVQLYLANMYTPPPKPPVEPWTVFRKGPPPPPGLFE